MPYTKTFQSCSDEFRVVVRMTRNAKAGAESRSDVRESFSIRVELLHESVWVAIWREIERKQQFSFLIKEIVRYFRLSLRDFTV